MKYCKHCGGEVEDDDVYCGYCGGKLKEDREQSYGYNRQDFKEESTKDGDFSNEFGSDFGVDFDNEFSGNDHSQPTDRNTSDKEFESYVENSRGPYGMPVQNLSSRDGGHKKQKFNKEARDANTFGILSVVFGMLGGFLGIVFGILGLVKAKRAMNLCDTGEYDGKPKASNGRILSIVGIVVSVFAIVFWYIL